MAVSHVKSNGVADWTGTVTVFDSRGSTGTAEATAAVRPSDWNSAHNQFYTVTGNTTVGSTASGTNVVFGASGGLSVGVTNGSQVFYSAPPLVTLSAGVLAPNVNAQVPFAQSSASLGQNSVYIYPVVLYDWLSVDHVRMPVLVTNSSSAAASIQKGYTYDLGIYSRHSTNATVLTRHYSTSYTMAASHSSNVSWMLSMITAIGNSTSYNTLTASSGGLNLSASLHGPREFVMPVSSLFSPGEWWFAVRASTSSAGAGGAVLNLSNLCVAHQTFNRPGLSTSATHSGFYQQIGMGTYSVTTGALPAGVSATQINQLGTMPILFAAPGTV